MPPLRFLLRDEKSTVQNLVCREEKSIKRRKGNMRELCHSAGMHDIVFASVCTNEHGALDYETRMMFN